MGSTRDLVCIDPIGACVRMCVRMCMRMDSVRVWRQSRTPCYAITYTTYTYP